MASTDVTKKSDVDTAFSRFLGDGKLNVLVSNAAMAGPAESVEDVDGDKFLGTVQQNLKGSLNVAQAFLRFAAADAVAIDVNSAAAHLNLTSQYPAYSTSKMAVFRLWDSLAFANPGLSVFHVQPGVVDTDLNKEVGGVKAVGFQDDGRFSGDDLLFATSRS